MNPDRARLRRSLREQRRALPWRERQAREAALTRELLRLPLARRARRIALFLPNDGEVDLGDYARRARELGKRLYLPVLSPLRDGHLWFSEWPAGGALVSNRFGIPEPVRAAQTRIRLHALDLVLAPLVAFDDRGHRLGMGGGFYDRSFAFLGRRQHWRRPRLIGVAFAFQQVEALPSEPWDVPLDGVVTDGGFLGVARG